MEKIPVEIQKDCRFILFEMGKEVLGFPYSSIQKINWVQLDTDFKEVLEIIWSDCIMKIQGLELRRLFLHFQKDEVFLVRKGILSGLSIENIFCEILEKN